MAWWMGHEDEAHVKEIMRLYEHFVDPNHGRPWNSREPPLFIGIVERILTEDQLEAAKKEDNLLTYDTVHIFKDDTNEASTGDLPWWLNLHPSRTERVISTWSIKEGVPVGVVSVDGGAPHEANGGRTGPPWMEYHNDDKEELEEEWDNAVFCNARVFTHWLCARPFWSRPFRTPQGPACVPEEYTGCRSNSSRSNGSAQTTSSSAMSSDCGDDDEFGRGFYFCVTKEEPRNLPKLEPAFSDATDACFSRWMQGRNRRPPPDACSGEEGEDGIDEAEACRSRRKKPTPKPKGKKKKKKKSESNDDVMALFQGGLWMG